MALKTLTENPEIRVYTSGRFPIQLEIPDCSTLSQQDIDRICSYASWETYPGAVKEYEGLRSILVPRAMPVLRRGIELTALQISGIGYREYETIGNLNLPKNDFFPPSKENFMNRVNAMGTSICVNGKIVNTRPQYRALGTYLEPELKEKVAKTTEVSRIHLEHLVTPVVEAYGRYLDESLKNETGNFGFIVFSVPSLSQEREAGEITKKMADAMDRNITNGEAALMLFNLTAEAVKPLMLGLRELHDTARYAHHQTHLSNVYTINRISYLMDWQTAGKLGSNSNDNVHNRVIDIKRPADNFQSLFATFFPRFERNRQSEIYIRFLELCMQHYSGVEKIDFLGFSSIVFPNSHFSDTGVIVEYMKSRGFEGYEKKARGKRIPQESKSQSQKIGRNDKCPCGSGAKFKNCCLRKR